MFPAPTAEFLTAWATAYDDDRGRRLSRPSAPSVVVQLNVIDAQGITLLTTKKHTPMRKLMEQFCSRRGLQVSQVRFMMDSWTQIAPTHTAEQLSLRNNDTIEVMNLTSRSLASAPA